MINDTNIIIFSQKRSKKTKTPSPSPTNTQFLKFFLKLIFFVVWFCVENFLKIDFLKNRDFQIMGLFWSNFPLLSASWSKYCTFFCANATHWRFRTKVRKFGELLLNFCDFLEIENLGCVESCDIFWYLKSCNLFNTPKKCSIKLFEHGGRRHVIACVFWHENQHARCAIWAQFLAFFGVFTFLMRTFRCFSTILVIFLYFSWKKSFKTRNILENTWLSWFHNPCRPGCKFLNLPKFFAWNLESKNFDVTFLPFAHVSLACRKNTVFRTKVRKYGGMLPNFCENCNHFYVTLRLWRHDTCKYVT